VDRSELTRRLKAARALGGYTKPETLALQPLLKENRIPASRIKEMESVRGRVDIRPMELEVIARACGLPVEWFSAPFERLAGQTALHEQVEALERKVDRLLERPDPAKLLREVARQAAEDALAGDRPGRAGRTRTG
jgi:hypothetical protein